MIGWACSALRRDGAVVAGVAALACFAGSAPGQEGSPDSRTFSEYAVAADHPLASQAGAEVLSKGGNAVDAAVATSFALSVVRPFSCGIGGGGFMVVYIKAHPKLNLPEGGIRVALNYRETAPAGVTPDLFEKLGESEESLDASVHGGKAVAVPGTVAGLLAAHERFGLLDRASVMAPAIRLASEGFLVDAAYARAAREIAGGFAKHPSWKQRFSFTWDRFLAKGEFKEGDRIALPEQGQVLERIAQQGATAFYSGPVAAAIVAATEHDGGIITAADLAGYQPAVSDPLVFTFHDRTFLGMMPPSSGGVAMAEALGILQRMSIQKHAEGGLAGVYLHSVVESFKHAFADRAEWLGDPAFVNVPVCRLLSDEYLAARAARIRLGRTSGGEVYGTREHPVEPPPLPDDGGTSHLCVIDAAGNAAACTETINLEFGSLIAVSGFCLNNQMDDFTTRRGKPNQFGLMQGERNLPAPGKRPLSSMSPTVVLSGDDVVAVAGASGGPRIITATTQVLLNALLFGQSAREAVAAPRFHHQWNPNVLEFEEGGEVLRWQGVRLIDWMRKCKHEVKMTTKGAAVQLILRDKQGRLDAASDPRKGGAPAGK